MELLGDGRTAHDSAALDDTHLQSGSRQIAGAGEAVVACTDDDDVEVFARHEADLTGAAHSDRRSNEGAVVRSMR